jgi:hypothetical protein
MNVETFNDIVAAKKAVEGVVESIRVKYGSLAKGIGVDCAQMEKLKNAIVLLQNIIHIEEPGVRI